jgi:L-lactate dehydrogenase (cytochrome)
MSRRLLRCSNIEDLRRTAKKRLPRPLFDFVDGGAEDERTLRGNREDFATIDLLPRVGVDVERVDTSVSVLGSRISFPLIAAPTGMTRLTHPDGEIAVARASARAGIVYCASTMASTSIEAIASVAEQKWFQLYCFRDRDLTREFMARAKASGYTALCITLDVPVGGNRERDVRSGMTIPPRLTLRSLAGFAMRPSWSLAYLSAPTPILANVVHRISEGSATASTLAGYIQRQFDPSISWRDVEWMIAEWNGTSIIKGILTVEDAGRSFDCGADAVVVSNHGGRQLDSAPSSISVLREVVEAVGERGDVLLDGGVRRGSDIAKALALGARACLVGRPYLYGLAAGGEGGVDRAFAILRSEFERTLRLMGCTSSAQLRGRARCA